MAGREGVRSSARLSGAGSAAAAGVAPTCAEERLAAAALRRERAVRAAERAREVEDSPQELRDKCRRLARALRDAKHLVVYTGAGISTAADIPDYRGPRGVWTRLQRGERVARVEVARARPTFTHMALSALWARGVLKFVVSQNCDGLHVRAGLPRRALAELHGDMFAERCPACRRVSLRAFDTTARTARHAHGTRRLCHACGRELQDSIVHFGERGRAAWPLNWAGALRHAAAADVVLCLGSSLKVLRRYPRLWRMRSAPAQRPALYIVNLQWTPKDAVAALKINARCDDVMAQVARRLRLRVPRYDPRADPLLAHAEPLAPPEAHTAPPHAPPEPQREPAPTHYYALSSPSASESDDEVPLRHLVERLRAPDSPPPAPDTPPPELGRLSPVPDTSPPALGRLSPAPVTPPLAPDASPPAPDSPPPALDRSSPAPDTPPALCRSARALETPPPALGMQLPEASTPLPAPDTLTLVPATQLQAPTPPTQLHVPTPPPQLHVPTPPPQLHVPTPQPQPHVPTPPPQLHVPTPPPQLHVPTPQPQPHVPTPTPHTPHIPGLHSFQVAMQAGETTILLRARHAPHDPPPRYLSAPPAPHPGSTGALRRFRMVRPRVAPLNGVPLTNGHHPPALEVKPDSPPPAKIKKEEHKNGELDGNGTWTLGSQLRRLLDLPRLGGGAALVQRTLSAPPSDCGDEANAALAAAIIQRAVLLCRAQLYSGLHTIILPEPHAPTPPPPPLPPPFPPPRARLKREKPQEGCEAECAWCLRRYAARRCLWYGPPLKTPPERRAWRRERGRRYLCACCGEHGEEPGGEVGGEGAGGAEGGGWYGKGYRKGRRKRR